MSIVEKAILPIYLLGTVLTFGHEAARFEREWPTDWQPYTTGNAILAAVIWPVYVPYRLSWEAFR